MSSTKAEIRINALQRRNGLDAAVRADFAPRLAAVGLPLVLDFQSTGKASVTTLFSSIGSEPDTGPLAKALRDADVPLGLPVDWSHGASLVFRRWTPGDRLAAGPLGIAEPLDHMPEVDPDILFVPLVAFDRRGHRLGYGAGNVDQTLRALRSRKTVHVIGVAYAVQQEPFVPNEAHDEPVDIVVTDRDVIDCRS